MRLALTNMDICWEDKEANKMTCEQMIREANERSADVILFPEMTLTGFSMDVDKIADIKEETREFFSSIAQRYHMSVGYGYVSREKCKGKNHFCLTDKEGVLLADYIKIHPFTYSGEADKYIAGENLCSTDLYGVTCGMFICYDLRFPESFQKLPDTDVVFVIANWPGERIEQWDALLRARAIEMQCYVAGVNRIGMGNGVKYVKSSVCYAPDGSRLREEAGEYCNYVDIDIVKRRRYVMDFPVRCDRVCGIDF